MATTAQRLKKALELRGMKQADLAEKTGIGKSSISTYLSGSYEPKQKNLHKIAEVLNVSDSWLLGYDVPMDSQHTKRVGRQNEKQQLAGDVNAFHYHLKELGWTGEWDMHQLYTLSNGIVSFKITQEEYAKFVGDLNDFFKKRLEELYTKSAILLFPKNENKVNAAHARTDLDITEGTDTSDDDIMDDENF